MNEYQPTSTSNDYLVNLDKFQGPMDLLLYLINKNEVDIYDIPIAEITKQYLEYVELMENLNLEMAGEYILMAATLIRLKTRLLLPRDPDELEENDPRHELMMALIEYRKYKEVGDVLRDKAIIEEGKYVPPSPVGDFKVKVDLSPGTTFFDLLTAFRDVMTQKKEEVLHEVELEQVSLEERVAYVRSKLLQQEFATFSELFSDMPRKIVAIVTFIALLEMARLRRINIMQSKLFEDIRVYRGENFSDERIADIEAAAREYESTHKETETVG